MGEARGGKDGKAKRRIRAAKMDKRMKLPARQRQAGGGVANRMHSIATTGPRPMGSCGSQVMGLNDYELLVHRRHLMRTAVPVARGSLTGKLPACGGPSGC